MIQVLLAKKIPLDAFLLYKSTTTGQAQSTGQSNPLLRSPMFLGTCLLLIASLGYIIYALSNMVTSSDEEMATHQSASTNSSTSEVSQVSQKDHQSNNNVSDGWDSNSVNNGPLIQMLV